MLCILTNNDMCLTNTAHIAKWQIVYKRCSYYSICWEKYKICLMVSHWCQCWFWRLISLKLSSQNMLSLKHRKVYTQNIGFTWILVNSQGMSPIRFNYLSPSWCYGQKPQGCANISTLGWMELSLSYIFQPIYEWSFKNCNEPKHKAITAAKL